MKICSVKNLAFFFFVTGATLVCLPVFAQSEETGLDESVELGLQQFDETQKLEEAISPLPETLAEDSIEEQGNTLSQKDLDLLSQGKIDESLEKQANTILEEDLPEVVASQPVEAKEWQQPTTNSAALQPLPKKTDNFDLESSFESDVPLLAQTDIELGRLTRSSFSYIGVGGNIGLTGDTGVGEGAFVVLSLIHI